jgi:hypothetical protein
MAAKKKAAKKKAAKKVAAPAQLVEGLSAATLAALGEVRALDWKGASGGVAATLGEDIVRLADRDARVRARIRARLVAKGLDHPIFGVAAPYLARLFADPRAPDRVELLGVLAAVGLYARARGLAERFEVPSFLDTHGRSRRERYLAVAALADEAAALLDGDEPARVASAAFLAFYPAGSAHARLRSVLASERSPLVLSAGLVALGAGGLGPPGDDDRALVGRFLDHADPRVSLAAAVAASFFPGSVAETALSRLEQELARSVETWAGFPFFEGRLGALAVARYLRLGAEHRERLLAQLPAGLGGEQAPAVAAGLVRLLFPKPLAAGEAPTPEQTRILRVLLSRAPFAEKDLEELLRETGLPDDLAELRDTLGLELPAPPREVLSRPIRVDGHDLPLHVAWRRLCWGRLSVEPERLMDAAVEGLDADAILALTAGLVALGVHEKPRLPLHLPELPGGERVEGELRYRGKVGAAVRGRALIDLLVADGWAVLCAHDSPPRDFTAHLVKGPWALEVEFLFVWSDDLHDFVDDEMRLLVESELSIARLVAPAAHALLGDSFVAAVTRLAERLGKGFGQDENMLAWTTLELAALLSARTGTPPAPAADALFRALHVTWIPMARRALYLAACAPARAEALALWMLSKEPGNDWLAAMVPSEKVKKAVAKGRA